MRKILFVMVAALAFVACEKDFQSQTEKTDLETIVQNNKVSLKQALLYAENSVNGINPTTRSSERKVKSTEIYVAKPATRSAEGAEVSFYLINYEDNEGFAMVSTDSRTTPVYAYADEGNITANELETNPYFNIFMDGAVPYYEYEVANYDEPEPIIPTDTLDDPRAIYIDGIFCYKKTDTIQKSDSAFITTSWHQHYPYNSCLENDNYIAGCSPVAAAQIMAYHEWPTSFDEYTFNYNIMKSEAVSYTKTPAANQAARLIERIGDDSNTEYGEEASSTNNVNIKIAFEHFGYTCSNVVDFSSAIIRNDIDNNRPILVVGYENPSNMLNGHSWVIDAYQHTYMTIKYYYANPPYDLYKTTSGGSTTYYRCNFGLENFVAKPYLLDTEFLGYIHNKKIIYNITPNN